MKALIREAKREDCQEVWRLIVELAEYEKMPDGPKISAEKLLQDGFGSQEPFYKCLVAQDAQADSSAENGAVPLIGYCLYFYTYSTWEGPSVYMEDLYVTPKHRNQGIGQNMWKKVVKNGLSRGCTRCNFAVLDWNKPSIDFYKAKGAVDLTEKEGWLSFRMEKPVMQDFVKDCNL